MPASFDVYFPKITTLNAQTSSIIKTADGVLIHTDSLVTGQSQSVKLEVVTENIIRVRVFPNSVITNRESLITNYSKNPSVKWTLTSDKESALLKMDQCSKFSTVRFNETR